MFWLCAAGLIAGSYVVFRMAGRNDVGAGKMSECTDPSLLAEAPEPPPEAPIASHQELDSITMTWKIPTETGGRKISKYLVQMQLEGSSDWISSIPQPEGSNTSVSVTNVDATKR